MGFATALGLAGLAATGVGMAQQQTAADYNERLALIEGDAAKGAIEEESRRLGEEQRELRASQRVALATSGADISQEQPLMLMADQANKMALDRLELSRRGEIAQSRGRSKSLLAKMQGREALISGGANLANQGYNLYSSYKGT